MKIVCPKCGKKLNKKAKFCLNCGEVIESNNDKNNSMEVVKEKKSFKKILVFALIGIILVIFLALAVLYFNSSINKFERGINWENYTAAIEIYQKNKDDIKFIDKAKIILGKYVDDIKQDYIQKKIDKGAAKNKLKELNDIINTKSIQDYIENLENSRKNYISGLEYYNNKDYEFAIILMKGVIQDDENFSDAINKINDSKLKYKDSLISKAQNNFDKKEYEQAVEILSKYEKTVQEKDTDIDKFIKDCETEISIIKEEQRKIFIEDMSSKISIVYDKVEDKYTIVPKNYSTRYVNIGYNIYIEPRIIYSDDVFALAYIMGFAKSDWIFFDNIVISNEKHKIEIKTDYQGKKTKVLNGGEIAEWYNIVHIPDLQSYVDYICDFSDIITMIRDDIDLETTIRFKGKGYYDVVMSKAEKQNIVNFYDLYNALEEDSKIFDELNK